MTRQLRIEWEKGKKVTGTLAGPGEGTVGVLLAHGAGVGQAHPFMAGLRSRLSDAGLTILSFDYPYMEEGRRAPDRLPRLLQCHAAALRRLAERVDSVVLAGKSMGGRVGGHLASSPEGEATTGLVFYGYPLVPVGSSEPRDTSHLAAIAEPMLFVQGERDRLAPLHLITQVAGSLESAAMRIVPDGDHSFRVPKRTGLDEAAVLDLIAGWTVEFIVAL